jgi:dihydroflavonol-4-reductase
MERELECFIAQGLRAVTLLPGGCVGPWDARAGTGGILLGVVRAELPWWVDGTVNLVDVADVARAHVLAAGAPSGERYCLGGHDVRVRWLLGHLAARFGGRVPAECLAPEEARARADAEEARAAPSRGRVPFPRELVDVITLGQSVSNAHAEHALGVRFGPLDDALDRAHAWYVRFRYLSDTTARGPYDSP